MKRIKVMIMASVAMTMICVAPLNAQKKKAQRNVDNVKKEQRETQKAIQATAQKIENNTRRTERSLNQLNALNAEIKSQEKTIAALSSEVDGLNQDIALLNDTIKALDNRVAAMKKSYANSVRSIYAGRTDYISKLAFVFASESFYQAYRRMCYLREFSRWSDRRSKELRAVQDSLNSKRQTLIDLHSRKGESMRAIEVTHRSLEGKRKSTNDLVAQLKRENVSLKKVLRDREARAAALDRELNRLIEQERIKAEEARRKAEAAAKAKAQAAATAEKQPSESSAQKPSTAASSSSSSSSSYSVAAADRELTGSFESNKGRLLFPVSGRYKIVRPFGRHQHPDLPHVVTDNGGIDVETESGAATRAVFGGVVSAIFQQPGFNTIVMVRHGSYLTIYANLTNISVKNGATVKQGQTLGRVYADPDDDNRSILHFEIRKEKDKLNPSLWVK